MAAVRVALAIMLFFLPLGVIGDAVGLPDRQPVGQLVGQLVGRRYYDYLQLVLQVPKTVKAGSTLNQKFTIHGLWPTNKHRNDFITNCDPVISHGDFLNTLSWDLQRKLDYSWPTLEFRDNWSFWVHEYNAHGRCADYKFRTPEAYFGEADDLYRKYIPELYKILRHSHSLSLIRSRSRSLSLLGNQVYRDIYFSDIKAKNYRKNPVLRCNGTGFLKEVIICYDNAIKRRHCGRRGNCPEVISYPINSL